MELRAGPTTAHLVEHGAGKPVIVLHGAGVDHREVEACFEPVFEATGGWRRIYPDLPGMGRTAAPESIASADDVLQTLREFVHRVTDGEPYVVMGHSAGAYYARAIAATDPTKVRGLALICPLLPAAGDVPDHQVVTGSGDLGDESFRSYFVVQTPEMLERYERYVAPGAALADWSALARIGERWKLAPRDESPYDGPTLIVAGRLDSTVGYRAAADLLDRYPQASLAVLDGAGHALPHEQPDVLRALVLDWLARIERTG